MIPPHDVQAAFYASYGQPLPKPKFKDGLSVLIEGAISYYRLPGFCAACDVYGAELETNCWNCGEHLLVRKASPGAGTSGGNMSPNAPTWRQVMGQDPYDWPPEPPLFPAPKETHGTPSLTEAAAPEAGSFSPDDMLRYWGGSPYGDGYLEG